MPKLAGVQHQRAVKAFEKAGFRVIREGKHISMAKEDRIIIIILNGKNENVAITKDEYADNILNHIAEFKKINFSGFKP